MRIAELWPNKLLIFQRNRKNSLQIVCHRHAHFYWICHRRAIQNHFLIFFFCFSCERSSEKCPNENFAVCRIVFSNNRTTSRQMFIARKCRNKWAISHDQTAFDFVLDGLRRPRRLLKSFKIDWQNGKHPHLKIIHVSTDDAELKLTPKFKQKYFRDKKKNRIRHGESERLTHTHRPSTKEKE